MLPLLPVAEPGSFAFDRWRGRADGLAELLAVAPAQPQNGAILEADFGIAVVEAVRRGCAPLLPRRLSYPELIPGRYHGDFLYGSQEELVEKLVRLLVELSQPENPWIEKITGLARSMDCYAWENLIEAYDRELDQLAR